MTISAVINAVLSIVFVYAMYWGQPFVPVAGIHGLVIDAVPQSFMVTLMSSLVPTLLTRRRVGNGTVVSLLRKHGWPRHALLRALAMAIPAAMAAGFAQGIALPFFGTSFAFADVVMTKAIYGGGLGAAVTVFAVRIALAEGPKPREAR